MVSGGARDGSGLRLQNVVSTIRLFHQPEEVEKAITGTSTY